MTELESAAAAATARAKYRASVDCLAGGGDMGAMMRGIDWSSTPVGQIAEWSQPFRTTVGLASDFA